MCNQTDIFTHVLPYYSYEIPYSCGPDPKICCQFDFNRLLGNENSCKRGIQPTIITESNVAQKSLILIDQLKKKSSLYRTNVLLYPLGDDFYYTNSTNLQLQYSNYQKLFDYMNSNLDLGVQVST